MRQIVGLLGTPIDILNTQEALDRLEQFVEERRFHQVATANTDFLINALDDRELRVILREADLVVPDGMPLIWAARLMRSPLPERVTGADLVPALASLAAKKGYRIFMLGARPEVAKRARARLEEQYPGIQIVGCLSPEARPLAQMDNETILAEIDAARPDILWVAFGNPKQEKWIHLHRERLKNVSICIGVGGTFDFLAGQTIRAPKWMQRSGLEWLFRLLQEPKRLWKRYYRDITQFSRYMLRQWWAIRVGRATGVGEVFFANVAENYVVISVIGDFSGAILARFQEIAETAIEQRRHILLDFQKVAQLDGKALGTLLNLPKRAAFRQCAVRLVFAPPHVVRALTRSHLEDGQYQVAETMAQAFEDVRVAGLSWRVWLGETTVLAQVRGFSERQGALALEEACLGWIAGGKSVLLDMRETSYVDSILLLTLIKLQERAKEANRIFSITPGDGLNERLSQERVLVTLNLCDTLETPKDARAEPEWTTLITHKKD